MPDYVSFPLIKPQTLEQRLYQSSLLSTTAEFNTLIVLPTGLGKTSVAIMLAAHRLNKQGGRILVLAPTRPLVEQHARSFSHTMDFPKEEFRVFTGTTSPHERTEAYNKHTFIFATPQVIQNDVIAGRIDLAKFSLLVFDECHRGTGDYPYPFIAEVYVRKNPEGRILGLTASPGASKEKIDSICKALHFDRVEIRGEADEDVKPYVHEIKTEWIMVDLPPDFLEVQILLNESLKERYERLRNWGYLFAPVVRKVDLLKLQGRLQKIISSKSKPPPSAFQALSLVAECLKVEHALALLETQGSASLLEYFKRMRTAAESGKTKAVKRVVNDARIEAALLRTYELVGRSVEHPKLARLTELVAKIFENPTAKIIVFSQYRDSVRKIIETLKKVEGCKPVGFIGQAGDDGLDQRTQVRILQQFKNLEYNCLVCTSVGEEGLDVPQVDAVVFYEPVPSEIRAIQRRGRTGRHAAGQVFIMMTKNTRDEGIYWSSHHKEKKMNAILRNLRSYAPGETKPLDGY